jgi:hypothetical protein
MVLWKRAGAAAVGACAVIWLATATWAQDSFGRFEGEVVARFHSDGRNLVLEKPFAYVDPNGKRWDVPAGLTTDGASIPRAFWVSHPPFTGKYRYAAVIHDYYCQTQSEPWQETHEAFYHAMRAAKVDDKTAKVMWAAVYYFGPRWGAGEAKRGPGADRFPSDAEQAKVIKALEAWVNRTNLSREALAKALAQNKILWRLR